MGGMVGSGMNNCGPRDRLISASVIVVKGEFKGYLGTVKGTSEARVCVELPTNNEVITIDKEILRRKKVCLSFRLSDD